MQTKILIVDDDSIILGVIAEYLENCGYWVHTAHSVEAAVDKIDSEKYHIVISDVNLPCGDEDCANNGLSLLKYVKCNQPHIEVILMSGEADTDHQTVAGRIGVYEYLGKPFPLGILKEKIELIERDLAPW
ncbi:MAG: response regulator [Deltaproteobacteria bacterium]|nr:response regulator [Deltaproteobacteria bacterium]